MARDGWRFVLPLVAFALILLVFRPIAPALLTALAVFLLFLAAAVGAFFRDPVRRPPSGSGLLLSPADGRVKSIDVREVEVAPGRRVRMRRVAIILTIFDVHVQRSPMAGRVASVRYNPGKFLNAVTDEKASDDNENNMMWIATACGPVGVKQIAGLVARRIVCWCKAGKPLAAAQHIGLIRFGSRVEVFFALEAEVRVRPGQYVRGGETIVAESGRAGREDSHS
jgi:phosphatidylserine decarboxylase